MERTKYITVKMDDFIIALVFHPLVTHKWVAEAARRSARERGMTYATVSAGFCARDSSGEYVILSGRSESLDLGPNENREIDLTALNNLS